MATAFARIASLIQAAVDDEWVKLAERVSELKAFAKPQVK